jgi:hypothetical protein
MDDKEKELLAQYHHTISEQLNSRLSESPKFFGLLIVVASGYGYVLSNDALSCNKELFVSASLLSYVAVLWASWYLAALGYAFRFLQNIQHCAEHALKWNPRFVPHESEGTSTFWLLPSIYHPHVAGLVFLLLIVCGIFGYHARHWFWSPCSALYLSAISFLVGVGFVFGINLHFKHKFKDKWRDPVECDIYSA